MKRKQQNDLLAVDLVFLFYSEFLIQVTSQPESFRSSGFWFTSCIVINYAKFLTLSEKVLNLDSYCILNNHLHMRRTNLSW